MIIVEDCVEMETESLKKYVESSNENCEMQLEKNEFWGGGKTKKEVIETRKKNFIEDPLYSRFIRKTIALRGQKT